jgi:putative ABC transport system permease protein
VQVLEAVKGVPGVEAASAVSGGLPLTGSWSRTGVEIAGRPKQEGDDSIDRRVVTPEYLQTLRIPLVRGRYLSAADAETAQRVVVINESAARRYWPDREALGQRIKMNDQELTVVGVVRDIRHLGPERPPRQECYVPLAQNSVIGMTLALRTHGDPMAVLPTVRSAIWSVNKAQRLTSDSYTLEQYMDR